MSRRSNLAVARQAVSRQYAHVEALVPTLVPGPRACAWVPPLREARPATSVPATALWLLSREGLKPIDGGVENRRGNQLLFAAGVV